MQIPSQTIYKRFRISAMKEPTRNPNLDRNEERNSRNGGIKTYATSVVGDVGRDAKLHAEQGKLASNKRFQGAE